LHQMQPGPADKSYGIHVAKLAGMPTPLLQRAEVILTDLEEEAAEKPAVAVPSEQVSAVESTNAPTEAVTTSAPVETPTTTSAESTPTPAEQTTPAEVAPSTADTDQQLSLFSDEPEMNPAQAKVIEQLSHLNLMGMTPMDVMSQVYKWQQKLSK